MNTPAPLCWLDTETTGLHPDEGHLLLEVAYAITDADLNILSERSYVIRQDPFQASRLMPEVVRDMHERNHLLHEVWSGRGLAQVEQEIIADIRAHAADVSLPVAGNSLTLDRAFLHRFMPTLNDEVLSYRNVDVSSIFELAQRWAPDIAVASLAEKSGSHRALADVHASISQLRVLRDLGFIGGERK
ncbi:oligoribonuclease [Leucobacter sp. HY1910]